MLLKFFSDQVLKTKLYLFDSMVAPIILYSSEVLGIYDYRNIDKLRNRICTTILDVRKQSSLWPYMVNWFDTHYL